MRAPWIILLLPIVRDGVYRGVERMRSARNLLLRSCSRCACCGLRVVTRRLVCRWTTVVRFCLVARDCTLLQINYPFYGRSPTAIQVRVRHDMRIFGALTLNLRKCRPLADSVGHSCCMVDLWLGYTASKVSFLNSIRDYICKARTFCFRPIPNLSVSSSSCR